MVDYSKWDKMNFDSDEESNNNNVNVDKNNRAYQNLNQYGSTVKGKSGLNITKLNETSSITFGGNSDMLNIPKNVTITPTYEKIFNTKPNQVGNDNKKQEKEEDKYDPEFKLWAVNGALINDQYVWSQTKDTITLHIFIPSNVKGKDVDIELLEKSLKIKLKTNLNTTNEDEDYFIEGEFVYSIVEPEDKYDIDWEIIEIVNDPMERKAIAIELKKKPIPGGMSIILWWNKCFTNELNEIDLSKIKERKQYADTAKVWNEAHEMFLQKHMKEDGDGSK